MKFKTILENFNTRLWSYHVKVPANIAKQFQENGTKRVVCILNGDLQIQCAIMPAGDETFFINLNKKIRDTLQLRDGSTVLVELVKDESEFGLPVPPEFAEVLDQDSEGKNLFDQLTPGKKRNLIYIAGQVKNSDMRIHRSLILLQHLKKNEGKINFKNLNQELRAKP